MFLFDGEVIPLPKRIATLAHNRVSASALKQVQTLEAVLGDTPARSLDSRPMNPDWPVSNLPPGPALPIDPVLHELTRSLVRGHAVLSAPPGSGKTTRVPLALLDAPWLAGRRILMLEPRRSAARLVAARMAHLLGEDLGETLGYQVRFERRIGPRTRIQVLTEGILTRRLQQDPDLGGVGLLIFDEFHERSLQADLGLALTLDAAAALRPDLRILVMSATLDTPAVARLLGGAPIIRGEGQAYPVDLVYAERTPGPDAAEAVVSGVRRALAERQGDVLAFLPGAGEIARARSRLLELLGDQLDVLPLHGSLSLADQDRTLTHNPDGRRRVILATDIAETSITIEGIGVVVDSGLTRKPRFQPGSGLTRLVTEPISRASAQQRAGRAGRLGPGTCYRLWTRDQEAGRPEHRPAEILQADLAPLALDLALWGLRDPGALAWLDPPPGPAWSQAVALLRDLGALDDAGAITQLGRRMAEHPLHPRLARMLVAARDGGHAEVAGANRGLAARDGGHAEVAGANRGLAARDSGHAGLAGANHGLAADLAALLSERDPWTNIPGAPRPADLTPRLHALESLRRGRRTPGLDHRRLVAIDRLARELARDLRQDAAGAGTDPGALLALAYPDRVARRRAEADGRYVLASGLGATLPPDDALAVHPYLVIAELDPRAGDGRIQLALPLAEADLREALGEHLVTQVRVAWEPEREAVLGREETRLGAIVLSSRVVSVTDQAQVLTLLLEQVARRFDQALPWTPAARQVQARIALLRRLEPDSDWPDLSDWTLAATLPAWLGPWLAGKQRLAEVQRLDLTQVLLGTLDWEHQRRLDEEAPGALTTPAGRRCALDYCAGDEPVLAVPLQEMFGTGTTPAVARGRIPVLLHLLSPARRPVQVTRDLAGFWARGYAQVRKELRGRYPKHHWPEDPACAAPVPGGINRRRPAP
jgi:ATP-dependent helicase HrpB